MPRFQLIATCGLLLWCGCQRAPQFTTGNRELLQGLQTAVSSKNTEWLDASEDQVRAKHEKGEIPDREFNALIAVIDQARTGDWKQAQLDCFKLSEGQVASSEDISRLKERPRKARVVTKK